MENLLQAHHAVFEGRGSGPVLQMCEEDLGRRSITEALYALRAVAVMLGSADVGAALFASSGIGGDVGAGLLMFMLGVVLWAFRLFGAGDAKLFLPIGLFVGWHEMLPFAFLLLVLGK
ncbi:Flp pilus assembly protein protease CpaA [Rhizobium leguminosarum]|uniref:Flp pilus assembly protein protease CpaA n=1 Tax=Rhizobium leguminosarum TaxID=384 RepID=A0A7W9ZY19_RHILE|nr:Flp pilus assembly protein protease CpaA [Rhizobium leguminosarum]